MAKIHGENKFFRFKENEVIVKLYDDNGRFDKSIRIPSALYPLNTANSSFEIFTMNACKEVTDERVLELFDSIDYEIGHCYTNTKKLVEKLKLAGFDAKCYAGWLFTGIHTTPIHHCWCILGDSLLDLADGLTSMFSGENQEIFENASLEESRELLLKYYKKVNSLKNSQRCSPVGIPTESFLYIGNECDAEDARQIYINLMRKYPNHECERNCDKDGYNPLQRMLKEEGFMK